MAITLEQTIEKRQHNWQSSLLASQTFWVVMVIVIYSLFLYFSTNAFGTSANLFNITRNFTFTAIIALGMTLVIITGGIDLSVGSVLCLCSMVLAAITGFVLRWTRFGRHVFAIGGNEHAAVLTGIPVRPIKVAVYMFCSFTAGVAAIVETGWLGAVTTNIGTGLELQVIAAAVIGGANLAGGIGTAIGALVGAALIEIIRNSLGLLGINAFWQGTIIGLAIIFAVMFDRIRNLRSSE
jgi:ribose/xylose/arabinose/galactoside ABC-type transport system permease subunit